MKFLTESGSAYEVKDGRVRRINEDAVKRADGVWIKLLEDPFVEVGQRVWLITESMADYGGDDVGTQVAGAVSTRITTPVVEVWDGENGHTSND